MSGVVGAEMPRFAILARTIGLVKGTRSGRAEAVPVGIEIAIVTKATPHRCFATRGKPYEPLCSQSLNDAWRTGHFRKKTGEALRASRASQYNDRPGSGKSRKHGDEPFEKPLVAGGICDGLEGEGISAVEEFLPGVDLPCTPGSKRGGAFSATEYADGVTGRECSKNGIAGYGDSLDHCSPQRWEVGCVVDEGRVAWVNPRGNRENL